MLSIVFTWLIVAWGAVSCIYMLRCAWRRFPNRDVDDVIPFLYPVDLSLAESLLDPAADFQLRWKLTPQQLRAAQRKRLRLYLEVVRRMSHNSKVLVDYAIAEKNCSDPQHALIASALQEKAIEVRLYALLATLKIRLWLLLRTDILRIMVPALAELRTVAEINGLHSYSALKVTAEAAFPALLPDEIEKMNRNL
jgi:hypothetical protein